MFEWYRGEDAGDLERSELNELVENWRHNDPGRKKRKSEQKVVVEEKLVHNVVMDEEVIQKIVMDEELIQKIVMDEKLVKNFVMNAKI